MRKVIVFIVVTMLLATAAFADYNTSDNMSVKHLKMGNRNATTSAEAAYYNPGGLIWGMEDGLTIEFSEMPSFQVDTIEVDYEPTAFGTTPNLRTEYEVLKAAPFIPALNVVYKRGTWAGFLNIGLAKGGGTGQTDTGLPSFDRAARGVLIASAFDTFTLMGDPNALVTAITTVDNPALISIDSEGKGSIASLGFLVGGAYAVSDQLAFGGGIRYAYQMNTTEATITTSNVSGNPMFDGFNNDIDVEYEETGSCFGIFVNVDYQPTENLRIANSIKYHTKLEMEADVKKDGGIYAPLLQGGGYIPTDGYTYEATYAPQWSLGISYQASPKLRVEFDYNMFFVSMVDDNENADRYEDTNRNVGIGMEYQYNEKLNIGAGFTYGFGIGLKDEFQSDREYDNHTLWLNTGATYNFSEKLEMTLSGQMGVQIEDPTQESDATFNPADPAGTAAAVPYKETYKSGLPMSLAIGVAYRF